MLNSREDIINNSIITIRGTSVCICEEEHRQHITLVFNIIFSAWRRHQQEWRQYSLSHPDHHRISPVEGRGPPKPWPQISCPPAVPCSVLLCRFTEREVSFLCTSCHHWVHWRCSRLASVLPTPLPGLSCPALIYPRPLPHREPEKPHPTQPLVHLSPLPQPSPLQSPPLHPHHQSPLPPDSFPILQYNYNGLQHCSSELTHFLATHSVLITTIRKQNSLSLLKTSSFSLLFLRPRRQTTGQRDSNPGLSARKQIRSPVYQADDSRPSWCLNSDHLPIAIPSPPTKKKPPRRTFTNFNKANWEAFTIRTEEIFHNAPLPSSNTQGEAFIHLTLQTTANRFIPRGCRKDFIPNLPPSSTNETYFAPPIPMTLLFPISTATSPQPSQLTPTRPGLTKSSPIAYNKPLAILVPPQIPLWQVQQSTPNQPITFSNQFTTSNPIIAQSFCRQFPIVPYFRPGPDNLTILHIHHLDSSGISYPANTFNLSLSHATIPSIWKTAIIITIPKLGKPPSLSSSYRHISLLCPAVKVLERLLLPHLTAAIPLLDSQHGFRPLHATTSALLPLSHTIAVGFNQHRPPLRTTIMAIDFSKAFDTVPYPQLISQISSLPLNHHIVRWLVCYLKGRSSKCSYHHHLSYSRLVLAGIPQGCVISPALFNLFVSDYPPTAPLITSNADDFTAPVTTIKIPDASAILFAHSSDVATWAQKKGLTVSIAKSQPSLSTPDTTSPAPNLLSSGRGPT
ncbi:Reverse transcriptase domain [Trinorchestia longiramus]|nr:Reverse transcriptase domain [Trinorchestia longiramus]